MDLKRVAVIGTGQTKFGEHWNKSIRELSLEAGIAAVTDSGIEGREIGALYIGNMSGMFTGQEHLGALAADTGGLNPIPATRCEAACASSAVAFRQAYLSILSGKNSVVMAAGAEKMTDIMGSGVLTTLMGAGDQEWEGFFGVTFSGLYALMARRHMHEYGTTREQIALVSVNNHKNGVSNEMAQFRYPITVGDVLKSSMVADPLRLLDCSPITDGAASVILASEEFVKENNIKNPVWICSSAQASAPIALHDRESLTKIESTIIAAKTAYKNAGVSSRDIKYAEVHDCFSINEILAIEDLGFCEKGKGGNFVEKELADSHVKINSTGGLKSIGHPVGATGVRQIHDISRILRNDSAYGLCQNIGGSGATCVISILKSDGV